MKAGPTEAGVLRWRSGLSAFVASAGAGLRTTILIMLAVLAINCGFLLLELSRFGSLNSSTLAIGSIPFGTGALVLVFGVLIPPGTTQLLQAALHENLERSTATGSSARFVKMAFTLNLLLIAAAAFLIV